MQEFLLIHSCVGSPKLYGLTWKNPTPVASPVMQSADSPSAHLAATESPASDIFSPVPPNSQPYTPQPSKSTSNPLPATILPWTRITGRQNNQAIPPSSNLPSSLPRGWRGKSLLELDALRIEGHKNYWSGAQRNEGISKLSAVVLGLERLLSPTHRFTISVSYELAFILRYNKNTAEAIAVLNWVTSEIVKEYDLHHKKTLYHCTVVVRALDAWSRRADADQLINTIAQLWLTENPITNPPQVSLEPTNHETTPLTIKLEQLVLGSYNESDTELVLGLLELVLLYSSVDIIDEAKGHLDNLVSYAKLKHYTPCTIRAYKLLVTLHLDGNEKINSKLVLEDAYISSIHNQVLELLKREAEAARVISLATLAAAREFAFIYYDCKAPSGCEKMLDTMANYLDVSIGMTDDHRHTLRVVDFLVSIAMEWQHEGRWDRAVPRLEHALTITINHAVLGPSDGRVEWLERCLRKKRIPFEGNGLQAAELEELYPRRILRTDMSYVDSP